MKKMWRILAVFMAAVLMAAVCGTAAAEQEARGMLTAADADEWIGVFLGEHPEDLDGVWKMTAQMEAAAAQLGGIKGLVGQLASLGKIMRIGSAFETETQGFQAFCVPCVFSAISVDLILIVQDGAIAGLTTGAYSGGAEDKPETESRAYESVSLALPVPALNGELPGTLTVPVGDGPFPAVVLVHGSGPCDRDETVGNLKPFRDLAEGLAERGIAVYRFDKRTYVYGAELAAEKQISLMDETITDAVNAVQLLAEQDKIDAGRIFVLGHSLGGNAVPAIARELEQAPVKARGFIMMAASPRPLDELMREQYDWLYSLMPEVTPEQQAEKDALFSDLDRLQDPDSLAEDDTVAGVYASYWKWLAAYDVLRAAEEITQPVLLLQGEEDYQVTMVDFGIWKEAFGGRDSWQLISYPELVHTFTSGQKTEGSAAYACSEKVDERVIGDIAGFIAAAAP